MKKTTILVLLFLSPLSIMASDYDRCVNGLQGDVTAEGFIKNVPHKMTILSSQEYVRDAARHLKMDICTDVVLPQIFKKGQLRYTVSGTREAMNDFELYAEELERQLEEYY